MNDNKQSKIIDNPTHSNLSRNFQAIVFLSKVVFYLEKLGIKNDKISHAFSKLPEILEQAKVLYLPDKFNDCFAGRGWIMYESMNVRVAEQAISIAESGKTDEAENFLADSYDEDTINSNIIKMKSLKEYQSRHSLIDIAKQDYLLENYSSCILILLTQIDGLVNDTKATGFFSESTDLTASDSLVGHHTGLESLKRIFNKSRNKTTTDKITVPYRNGILHGRDLNYGNKIVAAKCWSSLFACADLARELKQDKSGKEGKERTLRSSLLKYKEVQAEKERIQSWKPRAIDIGKNIPESGISEGYDSASPERSFVKFLECWKKKNFGQMSSFLVDRSSSSTKKKAGQIRRDFGGCRPIEFKLLSIVDVGASCSDIKVEVIFKTEGVKCREVISPRLTYSSDEGGIAIRGDAHGSWKTYQHFFSSIIYKNISRLRG